MRLEKTPAATCASAPSRSSNVICNTRLKRGLQRLLVATVALLTAGAVQAQTINATTYPFTPSTGASLVDMSSGTVTLLTGSSVDDDASAVTNIGFDYWFVGTRYSQFSVNANGLVRLGGTIIGTTFTNSLTSSSNVPQVAPYWDDLYLGNNGKVHYKVTGTAPNRVLVVEWQNMQIPRVGSGNAGAGTFQCWLSESTGVIDFVYGSGMAANATNSGASIGFGSSSSLFASVTVNATPPTVSYTTANNANTVAITSGTRYNFTPRSTSAPSNLTFTGVGLSAMTLNWTDNSTIESGYVIYRSTDGINYSFVSQVAANSTSASITGLATGTTYHYQVYAVTEGTLSSALAGSQSTITPINSVASGTWNDPNTWANGEVPSCSKFVTIASGHNVTVSAADGAANTAGITINTGGTLTVTGSTLTIGCTNNNAFLNNSGTLTVSGGTLNINGNLAIANGSTFSQSAGAINIDGNNGGSATGSVASGTPLLGIGTSGTAYASGTIALTGGTLTIVDPHTATSTTSSYALYSNMTTVSFSSGSGHNFVFGNGASTSAAGTASGFVVDLGSTMRFHLGTVTVSTGATSRPVTQTGTVLGITGSLSVSSGAFTQSSSTSTFLGGSLSVANGAAFYALGTTAFSMPSGISNTAVTSPQSVSVAGTGIIANSTTTASANFNAITINNTSSSGVTFNILNNAYAGTFNSFAGTSASTITFNGYASTAPGAALIYGTATATGTLNVTSGGMLPGSTIGRTWTSATAGSTISSGSIPATTSQMPFVDAASATANVRHAWVQRVTPSAAGITAVTYTNGTGTSTVNIVDGAYNVNTQFNGSWSVSSLGTTPSAATFNFAVSAPNAFGATLAAANARITTASGVIANHQAGTTLPHAQRTGLTLAQLTGQPFFIGVNSADIPFASRQSGSWNDPATWNRNTVPTCSDAVQIASGHTVTVDNTVTDAVASALTINANGVLTISGTSGQLTVGCTGNNNIFTNLGTLNLTGSKLMVNGNVVMTAAQNFNMSGGQFFVDPNSGTAASSVANGTIIFAIDASVGGSVNGGNIIIVDPHQGTATAQTFGFSGSASNRSWAGNTLTLGGEGFAGMTTNTTTSTRGFEMDCYISSVFLQLGDVVANGSSAANRFAATANATGNGTFMTNLTVNSGAEFRNTTSTRFSVAGNITNNGTLSVLNTLQLAAVAAAPSTSTTLVASTLPQTIGGTGVFQNLTASATASMASLTINNSNATGVTLQVPLSISGMLTMTSGLVNTSNTNLLSLGTTTTSATFSGTTSATNMIVGPFARTFGTRSASGTYSTSTIFPVGKGITYAPIFVDPATTGTVVIRAEAFTSNAGSPDAGVSNLSATRWEVLTTSGFGNLTSAFVRASEAGMASGQQLVQAPAAGGTYSGVPGVTFTFAAGTPPTITSNTYPAATLTAAAYLAYANLTPCVAPANQPTGLATTSVTTTSINANFTAAAGAPTGYLVVRYPSGATPTAPVDGTVYSAGNSLGSGQVVQASGALTISNTGLTAGTTYTYYVYAYNNSACSGIAYNTASPLTASFTTCPGTPTASAATGVTSSGFTANWSAVTGAASYLLDVSTSSTFATFLSGFNGLNVGNVTTYAVTSTVSNAPLYYRVRALNASCNSSSSSTITVCAPYTVPYAENFNASLSIPGCSAAINSGSGNTWAVSAAPAGMTGNALSYTYNSSFAANTWWFTPGIQLTSGVAYRLTYKYGVGDALYAERMKVAYGTTATAAGMTTVLKDHSSITNTTPATETITVTPSATGIYYFGFQAYSVLDQYILYVDDVAVQAACATPNAVTALSFPATGPSTIQGSFAAPSPAPSNYLVVRYPTGNPETAPVNGTVYTAGQALGAGTVVSAATGTTFSATGLAPNTAYDFYVYAYNNAGCYDGPAYAAATTGTSSTGGCATLNTTLTVGPSGDYQKLSDLALVLNGCPVSGPTVVKLMADYNGAGDSYPIVFTNNSGASAVNTITIRPDDAVNAILTLAGSSTSPLIDFSGARYYTIDGRPGSTGTASYLTIQNSGDGAAFRLINDAQNNSLTYTTLKAANTSATNGVVRIAGAAGATSANGNNNNSISNNNIDGNGTSPNGIYAAGDAAPADNKAITISNNNIYNYFSDVASIRNAGIQISSGNGVTTGWTISGNSFYQAATRTYATAVTGVHAINQDGADNPTLTITGNFVGGTQPSCGGSAMTLNGSGAYAFSGMRLFPGSTSVSTVSNNTVQNISITTASTSTTLHYGIGVQSGQATVSNNVVGSASTPGSITFSGGSSAAFIGIQALNGSSTTGQNLAVSNNTVAGIAVSGSSANQLTGINVLSATTMTGTNTISNNTIGTLAAPLTNSTNSGITGIVKSNSGAFTINGNSVRYLTSTNTGTSGQVIGILVSGGSNTVGTPGAGNTVSNLTSSAANTSTTSSASVIGISVTTGTAGQTVAGNTVSALANGANASVIITGISLTGSTTGTNSVSRNMVYGLAATHASATGSVVNGISVTAGSTTFSNNVVRLGTVNPALANSINGIVETSGTNNWYFNSVYIGGSGVGTTSSNTYAFNSSSTGTRIIRNNAFQNARTNATTGGKHYAIAVGGTTASPSGLTLSNNVYYANAAASGFLARYNSADVTTFGAWRTTPYASGNGPGLDANSFASDPNYMAPTAAVPDLSPNPAVPSALESQALVVSGITVDFAGTTRNASTPDIGAYEFNGTAATPSVTIDGITPAGNQCTATAHTVSVTVVPGATPITAGMVNLTYTYNGSGSTTIPMTNTSGNTWTAVIPAASSPVNATVAYSVSVNDGSFSVSRTGTSYSDVPLFGLTVTASGTPLTVCSGGAVTLTDNYGDGSASAPTYTAPTQSGSACMSSVGFNTLSKTSFTSCASPYYTANAATGNNTTLLIPGRSYTFNLTLEGSGNYAGVWIDYNGNGTFESSEYTQLISSGSTAAVAITIPSSARIGRTGLRVRSRAVSMTSSDGAASFSSGVTEDFVVQISNPPVTRSWSDGTTVVGTTSPLTVNPATTTTYTLTLTDANGCTLVSNGMTVTAGTALVVAPSASSSTICAGASTTLSANATGGGQPYTYIWRDANNNQIGTAATVSVTPATTTTYTVTVTDNCSNVVAQPVTITVNPLPVVTLSPAGTQAICTASQVLTPTTNAASPSYQWLLANANISSATGATYTATASGAYSVRVTDGATGCIGTSAATTLTFNGFPGAITVTPAGTATICLGQSQPLTASASLTNATAVNILSENFNSGAAGWSISSNSVNSANAPITNTNWVFQAAPYTDAAGSATFTNFSVDNSTFALVNADAGGSGSKTRSVLASPAFSTQGYASASLRFQHVFQRWSSGDSLIAVQYSTDGTNWTLLKSYTSNQGTTTSNAQVATQETIALPAGALNQSNLRVRFFYVSTFGYYWLVDNVAVTGTPSAPQFAWSSASGNAGIPAAAASAALANSSVSVTPTAIGQHTYTVTASVAGSSCTTTNTVTVNVLTPSTAPSSLNASASTVCSGTDVLLTQTGGSLGDGAYWQWYSDASYGTSFKVGGPLMTANAQLTVSPAATTTYYLRAEGGTAPCAANVSGAATVTVSIYAPAAGGVASSDQTITAGTAPAALNVSDHSGTIARWTSASDAGFTQNVTHYANTTTTLSGAEIGVLNETRYFRAEVTSGGCTTAYSNTVTITVIACPASFTVSGSGSYCDGLGREVTLSGSETGMSYQLKKGGLDQGAPLTGTGAALSFGIQTAGTYTVVASNGAGCTTTMTGAASITNLGTFTAQIAAVNPVLCAGTSTATDINITGGPANGQ
ncbi:beta strand repeat-containing protein, partial [Flaviaesturariibacter amylovorans]|uniref:beta strand repeat-containing protein n=2 Tax=Flaviaesturariibacter amylovorans TaxID=1084520 RepID=UPI0031E70685